MSGAPERKHPETPVLASSVGLPPSFLRLHELAVCTELPRLGLPRWAEGRQPAWARGPGLALGGQRRAEQQCPRRAPRRVQGGGKPPVGALTGLSAEAGTRAVLQGAVRR